MFVRLNLFCFFISELVGKHFLCWEFRSWYSIIHLLNVDTCNNGEGQGIDQEEHSFQPRCNHCPILHDDATPLIRRKVGWLMEGGAVWRVKKRQSVVNTIIVQFFIWRNQFFSGSLRKSDSTCVFIPAAQRHGLLKGRVVLLGTFWSSKPK